MGKIVAVCSEDKKSGKSVVTFLLANKIKKSEKNLKILVCCLNLNYSALYKLFGIDYGAVGLEDLVNYNFFEEESEVLLSIIPQSEDIYFLGSYRTTHSYVQKNVEKYCKLFEKLQNRFDVIIFDTVSGNGNILTDYVLQKADVMLKLFVQDNESMKKLGDEGGVHLTYGRETIYIISKYRDIYPRVSDIKRRYSLKKVFAMQYCEKLQEMKNRDSLHLYPQHDTSCNESVKYISKHILESMDLIPQESSVKESTRRYKSNLKNALKKLKLIPDGGKAYEDNTKFVPKRANGLY
jgi:cellulose biosynthesis protein BcsQ